MTLGFVLLQPSVLILPLELLKHEFVGHALPGFGQRHDLFFVCRDEEVFIPQVVHVALSPHMLTVDEQNEISDGMEIRRHVVLAEFDVLLSSQSYDHR